MSISLVYDIITGAGVAGAVLFLMIVGQLFSKGYVDRQKEMYETMLKDKDDQIAEKNEAIRIERDRADAERRRADVATESVQANTVLLAALTGRREIGAS